MTRFDFNLGGEVWGKDEPCGKLAGVVIYPETLQVTDLIVQKGLLPFLIQKRVLPVAKVQSALDDDLYVSMFSEEISRYPEYLVKEYEEPATSLEQSTGRAAGPHSIHTKTETKVPMIKRKIREGIAGGQVVIDRAAAVNNLDKTIGKVSRVLVERDNNKITHLVVKARTLFGSEEIVVLASMIENVGEENLLASVTNDELEQLSRYTPEVKDSILTTD